MEQDVRKDALDCLKYDMLQGSTMKVVLLICNVQLNSTNSNCASKAVGRLYVDILYSPFGE